METIIRTHELTVYVYIINNIIINLSNFVFQCLENKSKFYRKFEGIKIYEIYEIEHYHV